MLEQWPMEKYEYAMRLEIVTQRKCKTKIKLNYDRTLCACAGCVRSSVVRSQNNNTMASTVLRSRPILFIDDEIFHCLFAIDERTNRRANSQIISLLFPVGEVKPFIMWIDRRRISSVSHRRRSRWTAVYVIGRNFRFEIEIIIIFDVRCS